MREHASCVGAPASRVYRQLAAMGHGSGRRRRADAGATAARTEDLEVLASMMATAVRRTGQAVMYIPDARQILQAAGHELGGLSDGQLARLLRSQGIDLDTQRRGQESHVTIRTGGPNDLHLVDPSSCLVYYLPPSSRTRRRQRNVADIHGVEPYKNKPGLTGRKADLRVWRYVLVDHTTGALRVRYYQQAGENAAALWDFLCYAWDRRHAWHGLPNWLWWDKGSNYAPIRAALDSLGVEHYAHATGNSRAKGAVERAQRIVETKFESRLALQPVSGVEELNERAERWCDAYNANAIPGMDCRMHRRGMRIVRLEAWQRIRPGQLRMMPEDGRDLAVYQPVKRKVAGDLTISYRHPRLKQRCWYRVSQLAGVRVGAKVTVQPLLVDDHGAIRVRWNYLDEEQEERLQPMELDEMGLPVDGPAPGEFRRPELTEVEQAGERLRALAGPRRPGQAAFGGKYRALDAAEGDGTVIPFPRRGVEVETKPEPAGELLGLADAARYVRARLGDAWSPDLLAEIRQRWPDGASAAALDGWMASLSNTEEGTG